MILPDYGTEGFRGVISPHYRIEGFKGVANRVLNFAKFSRTSDVIFFPVEMGGNIPSQGILIVRNISAQGILIFLN